jgi:hypothetical protein
MALRTAKHIIGQDVLFEGLRPEIEDLTHGPITPRQKKRISAAVAAREHRETSNQELGYNARPFTVTNLPVRPKPGLQVWERRNGTHYLRIEAAAGHLLPYGQDRLVLVLLATAACQQKNRVLRLGSASDILRLFGKSDAGVNYERLAASFHRIMAATITWGNDGTALGARLIEASRMLLLEEFRLWAGNRSGNPIIGFENVVTLSERFYTEITEHPIPVDMDVVRGLLDSPAALDFYVWIAYRAKRVPPGQKVQVPLFGPNGLQAQVGTECSRPRKFRELVRDWLALTKTYWPECPVQISTDGHDLLIIHGEAIRRTTAAKSFLLPPPVVRT